MNNPLTYLNATAVIISVAVGTLTLFATGARAALRREIQKLRKGIRSEPVIDAVQRLKSESQAVQGKIDAGRPIFERLQVRHVEVREKLRAIDVGLVPPTFRFDDDEKLKQRIDSAQAKQLRVILSGDAVTCSAHWSVNDSQSEGQKMAMAYKNLALKAFNNEFDVIRKTLRHSTMDTAKSKLSRLNDQIDKLGEPMGVHLDFSYVLLKREELEIWHTDLVRKEHEKEKLKARRLLLKAQGGGDASQDAIDELVDDIDEKERALQLAKERAKLLFDMESDDKAKVIERLQREIETLKAKKSRALSQAQITRAGYVYVISNIGCFGDGVVKIGMTRRLNPLDRVIELGDASVAFRFDVHTIAFADDAPSVESRLHNIFGQYRVNTDNHRKEFFRVTPRQVETEMARMNVESDWYFEVEAREFRESALIRQAERVRNAELSAQQTELTELPATI